MKIENRTIYLEEGETVEIVLRTIIDENIFPKGSIPIKKVSKDFLREYRKKIKWNFNEFNKKFIIEKFGTEFYKEIVGEE